MSLIVLEGLDGAGKSTQIQMLQELLTAHGLPYAYLHFPRFDAPIYGELIARFLRGELGSLSEVDPYIVALLYAGDRAEAATTLRRWMEEGKTVILDRYVYSNIAYQCAKIADPLARQALQEWILQLEYTHHHSPRPDCTLFLDVPFDFTRRKLTESRDGADRDYLQGKQDIHEASLSFQQRVREVYLAQTQYDPTFKVISCATADGQIASPETIFEQLQRAIRPLLP
ncbi:MAG: dTMP kinase [Alistipes sp.]|nr:dTMP kinase [Alistipes sp.]